MLELEVKEQNRRDPSIHGCIGLDIRVVNHPLDVFSVDFDSEISYSNNPDLHSLECSKKTVEFDFCL